MPPVSWSDIGFIAAYIALMAAIIVIGKVLEPYDDDQYGED